MEELVPIHVKKTKFPTEQECADRYYYNIVVSNCPPYVESPDTSLSFMRAAEISRLKHNDLYLQINGLTWPPHPVNNNGEHIGAIIILESVDNRVLLLRNGQLWGLPKGVRNYNSFTELKSKLKQQQEFLFDTLVLDTIETAEENICRETLEETGIVLEPRKLILWPDNNYAYTRFIYKLEFSAADYIGILRQNGTDHENDEIRWFEQMELQELLTKHRMFRNNKVFNHVTFLFLSQYIRGSGT